MSVKIKQNHQNFTARMQDAILIKELLSVKAVWCMKAVERIARQGLETVAPETI